MGSATGEGRGRDGVPVECDSRRLQPSEPHQGGNGLQTIHLLLSDPALTARLVGLGATKDHEALLSLRELGVLPLSTVSLRTDLLGKHLGLDLQDEGTPDVAPHGCTVLEEVLDMQAVERAGPLERFLKVFGSLALLIG